MSNNKSPGNDDLKKEFFETLWNELKEIFVDSLLEAKEKGHLSISQRQTIIKLIKKKKQKRETYKKLETHFFMKCRSKNNIKNNIRETK